MVRRLSPLFELVLHIVLPWCYSRGFVNLLTELGELRKTGSFDLPLFLPKRILPSGSVKMEVSSTKILEAQNDIRMILSESAAPDFKSFTLFFNVPLSYN